jgi:MinD-like ATPase involved in chromosome partitioning or flagellar assembly
MKSENKTVFVAFSSQKGGVGKSAFTVLAASVLHYRLGYQVAGYDRCDGK